MPAVIEAADRIFVTADSVAMAADAIMTSKPVQLIPIAKSPATTPATGGRHRSRSGRAGWSSTGVRADVVVTWPASHAVAQLHAPCVGPLERVPAGLRL